MNGYAYESMGSAMKRGYNNMPIAIRTILAATLIAYLLQVFLPMILGVDQRFMIEMFGFVPTVEGTLYQPCRLVTNLFLHGGFWHLVFNMLWLWELGRRIERFQSTMALLLVVVLLALVSAGVSRAIRQAP
jgi:membrane associated rhomboid family serine protease